MAEEPRNRPGMPGIGEGIRTGIGILSAFKEAIEETLEEATERGDLSPERARRAMGDAAQRLQATLEETRGRLADFAPGRELEELRASVDELRERVARLEAEQGRPTPVWDGPGEEPTP